MREKDKRVLNTKNVLYKIFHFLTHWIRSRFYELFLSFVRSFVFFILILSHCVMIYLKSNLFFFLRVFFSTPCIACCKLLRSALSFSSKKNSRWLLLRICVRIRENERSRSFVFGARRVSSAQKNIYMRKRNMYWHTLEHITQKKNEKRARSLVGGMHHRTMFSVMMFLLSRCFHACNTIEKEEKKRTSTNGR